MRLHVLKIPSGGTRTAAASGSACSQGRSPSPTSHSATRDKQEPFCFLFATLEDPNEQEWLDRVQSPSILGPEVLPFA